MWKRKKPLALNLKKRKWIIKIIYPKKDPPKEVKKNKLLDELNDMQQHVQIMNQKVGDVL